MSYNKTHFLIASGKKSDVKEVAKNEEEKTEETKGAAPSDANLSRSSSHSKTKSTSRS